MVIKVDQRVFITEQVHYYSTIWIIENSKHFTARRKALQALYYATTYPPVCLSARPSHSFIVSKQGNAEGCGLHHPVARVSSFLMPGMVDGRRPCPGKI